MTPKTQKQAQAEAVISLGLIPEALLRACARFPPASKSGIASRECIVDVTEQFAGAKEPLVKPAGECLHMQPDELHEAIASETVNTTNLDSKTQ
jgi:hypothetical protein